VNEDSGLLGYDAMSMAEWFPVFKGTSNTSREPCDDESSLLSKCRVVCFILSDDVNRSNTDK
jgi:hypothetical protein